MPEAKSHELTLYVQSRKVVTSFFRPAVRSSGGASVEEGLTADLSRPPHGDSDASHSGEEAFFLSDDQARCVALTEELALKRGYSIRVVDTAKVGRFERLVAERLRGVQNFPVLTGQGEPRLEGVPAFTEDHICELMPAEMPTQRAYTYLKIRGGDL